jgi:hypothetical protein
MKRCVALISVLACSRAQPPAVTSAVSSASTPTPPTTATVAPYDLEADRARIAALARDELGQGISVQTAQGVFVLVAAPGWNARALAASTDLTTRAIGAYFNGRFDKKPEHAIGVYLFPEAKSYQAYCRAHLGGECDSPFGMYHPDVRRIVMNAGPGLGTLTHELVHPIVETDFPRAPTWLNEGIASLFEAPMIPKAGEIHGVKNWRLPRLLSGMISDAERGDARLDALFTLTDDAFRGPKEKLYYATARYVCQWLDARGLLWPFYRAWRDGLDSDPTGEKAFERVTGQTPARANAAWTAWVKAL